MVEFSEASLARIGGRKIVRAEDSVRTETVVVKEESSTSKETGAAEDAEEGAGEGAGGKNMVRTKEVTIVAAEMESFEPEVINTDSVDVGGAMTEVLGGTNGAVDVAINWVDSERVDAVAGIAILAGVEAKDQRQQGPGPFNPPKFVSGGPIGVDDTGIPLEEPKKR